MDKSIHAAEATALQCLGWLVANDELLPIFLGSSGLNGADLKERAQDREFLTAVLDFLVMDDAWVVACCDDQGLDYDAPMRARVALGSGAEMHWT